jgi:hypothetical protein
VAKSDVNPVPVKIFLIRMLNRGISGKNDHTVSNRLTKEVISVGMYVLSE